MNQTTAEKRSSLVQHKGLQQLIKFCIVGLSSTAIDIGGLWLLLSKVVPSAPWFLCKTVSFSLGVTNGFIWNRRWTFEAIGHAKTGHQYLKFFLVNIVGLCLSLLFIRLFLIMMMGQTAYKHGHPSPLEVVLSSLLATPIVVIWNFGANKLWTFRAPAIEPA